MPGYILTGTPGAGKTAILRQLELNGHAVVEEAATDIIAVQHAHGHQEPWRDPAFVDDILALQRHRQVAATTGAGVTFFDRSPFCTLALSRYLGRPASRQLLDEIERLAAGHFYERTVLFVRNRGVVEATAARRITVEQSLVFEQVHERTYREFGFDLFDVPAAPLPVRVAVVEQVVQRLGRTS